MSNRTTCCFVGRWLPAVLFATILAGCGKPAETNTVIDTGARETINTFASGMVGQDWAAMYALIDQPSKQRLGPDQFTNLAKRARSRMGFEPESVRVQSCEEHGDEAVSHLVYMTKTTPPKRRFLDGLVARKVEGKWVIALPANFGK